MTLRGSDELNQEGRSYYPLEVLEKKPAHPTIDIYMATMVMVALLGGDVETGTIPNKVPAELRNLLKTCLQSDMRRRPQNAWNLHDALDNVLKKLVDMKAFRVFEIPSHVGG